MHQVKKTRSGLWQRRVTLLVVFLVALWLGKAVVSLYYKNKLAQTNAEVTLKRYQELLDRQKLLEYNVNKLQTAEGVEDEIRRNFPVAKAGESVINILDKADASATATTTRGGLWGRLFKKY